MNTLLADPPAASGSEQPSAAGLPPEASTPAQLSPHGHTCAHCGAPLQEGQQWCLQCGASEPGSLDERPNWRPLIALALAAAILAVSAVVAGAAALAKHNTVTHVVALVPATPTVTTPTATTPTTPSAPTTPGSSSGVGGTGSSKSTGKGSGNLLFPPAGAAKPPKLPTAAPTPNAGGDTGASGESTGTGSGASTTPAKTQTTETTPTTESKSNEGSGKSAQPNPILLDTDAATTYNPYNYPPAGFGDPALAIDGEPTTAWSAQVQASTFPHLAMGLLVDLRSPMRLGSLELATPTRGMTVQIYGASTPKAPTTITEPGWVLLSGSHVLKKKVTHLKLRTEGRTFRDLLVWVTKAPAASQGTAQTPGYVALSEVALYPPAS